ncbi:MAG: amidase [Gammaproteobacteria bacterium]|nr:amidase [Gammaproteobacteria bacterium]
MNNEELWRTGAAAIANGIRKKSFSAREVVTSCLQRYEATHSAINALTEVRPEAALAAADAADRAISQGAVVGLLHGVPVTIKGNVDLEGWATVNGCAALRNNIARTTSPCVQNWLKAGAIVIGRSNTPEFCCRWETNNELFGPTRNPWDRRRTPGGSSGGAAASLAVGVTPLAQGNDLGGSLRQPAQACGVASLRPSFGRVPAWNPTQPGEPGIGVQIMHVEGPMARRIEDVRLGLRAMVARDRHDPWWVPAPLEQSDDTAVTAALVINPAGGGVNRQVASGIERAGKLLSDAGYKVEEIEPPGIAEAARIWRVICIGELLTQLEPAVKDICGAALRRTFDCYRAALPEFNLEMYADAFARRLGVLRDWLGFFERYGLIVAPVGTEPPLPSDGDIESPERTVSVIESFRMTVAVNALGLPAAVVPVGTGDGLPQVAQIIGPPFREMRCLAAAEAIERQVTPLTPIDPR